MKDHFKEKAQEWDKSKTRNETPQAIATAINEKITLTKDMTLMDFGVGTGLLGFIIAKDVKKMYGVDMSKSMLAKLEEKNSSDLHIEAICQDIVKEPLSMSFDGIISSMTLHHIENLNDFFTTIYKNIKDNGFLALADLELEDGTFHSDNSGVYHFGFEKEVLCSIVEKSGFKNVVFERVTTINKPQRDFGVFLLTAQKKN